MTIMTDQVHDHQESKGADTMADQDFFNFNTASEQRSVVPAGEIVVLQLTIRPGGAGDGGWLRRSHDGGSEGLDCEFTVVDGKYAKWKLWQLFTLRGTTEGHAQAGERSRETLRAILESARGIRPDDQSDAAKAARCPKDWSDFDQLRFMARLGVKPSNNGYAAKNTIDRVITPEHTAWKQSEQIDRSLLAGNAGKPVNSDAPPTSQPAPANAIARPKWAE
jgi:hypothetical protein